MLTPPRRTQTYSKWRPPPNGEDGRLVCRGGPGASRGYRQRSKRCARSQGSELARRPTVPATLSRGGGASPGRPKPRGHGGQRAPPPDTHTTAPPTPRLNPPLAGETFAGRARTAGRLGSKSAQAHGPRFRGDAGDAPRRHGSGTRHRRTRGRPTRPQGPKGPLVGGMPRRNVWPSRGGGNGAKPRVTRRNPGARAAEGFHNP